MKKKREFLVLIGRDEDGVLVGTVPALKGCHSQAKSLPVLLERIKEAIALCLEVEHPSNFEFVGLQEISV